MKYYDVDKRRLIYIKQKASSDFWDDHWKIDEKIGLICNEIKKYRQRPILIPWLKYLSVKGSFWLKDLLSKIKPQQGLIPEENFSNHNLKQNRNSTAK